MTGMGWGEKLLPCPPYPPSLILLRNASCSPVGDATCSLLKSRGTSSAELPNALAGSSPLSTGHSLIPLADWGACIAYMQRKKVRRELRKLDQGQYLIAGVQPL